MYLILALLSRARRVGYHSTLQLLTSTRYNIIRILLFQLTQTVTFSYCRIVVLARILGTGRSSQHFKVFVAQHPPVVTQKRVSTHSLVSKPSLSEAQALLLEFPFSTQTDLDGALNKKCGGVTAVMKPRAAYRNIDDPSSNSGAVSDEDSKKSDSEVLDDAVGPAFDAAELDTFT